MSNTLLIIVTILYACIAASMAYEGRMGVALMYFCYSVANIGVMMAIRGI